MNHMKSCALVLAVCVLVMQPLFAQDETVDYDVFSLEDLFKLEVITASKQEELIYEAPGVVSVVTAYEIEQFGANNLWELLDRIAGVQYSFGTGLNRVTIRGGDPNQSTRRVLMLIDGRPFRTLNGNNAMHTAFYTFPIQNIERIEIVRGPGSVLYGTNAMEGVINIITKKEKVESFQLRGQFGRYNTKSAQVSHSYAKGDFRVKTSATFRDTEGWPFEAQAFSFFTGGITTVNRDVFEDTKGINLSIDYKGLSVNAFYSNVKKHSEGFYSNDHPLSYHTAARHIDVSYSGEVNDNWKYVASVTNNTEDMDFIYLGLSALPFHSNDSLIEATTYGEISDDLKVIAGVVFQDLKGEAYPSIFGSAYGRRQSIYSAYSQVNYRANRFIKLIGGVQFNKPEDKDSDFVPRIGGIFSFSPRTGAKVLFGEAYRAPNVLETDIESLVEDGNPDLESEQISTFDLQVFTRGTHYEVVASFYRSKEKDLIVAVPTEDFPAGVYQNQGELTFEGFELEGKYAPNPWFINFYATYQTNVDQDDQEDTTYSPRISAKLGVGVKVDNLRVAITNNYYDKFERIDLPDNLILNPQTNSVNLMDFNLNWSVSKHFTIDIYAKNLLDEQQWVSEYLTESFNTIPGKPGRSLYFGAALKL